jgi:hypothetical protein
MKRRIALLCGVGALVALAAPGAQAGQGVGACQLDGTADFSKGLSTTAQDFTYSFAGTLASCQGTFAEKAGTVSAGRTIRIGSVDYQPIDTPKGNGSCASSTTSGTALVQWDNGKLSAIAYATKGVAAAVALTGTFSAGTVTLTRVTPDPADATHTTDTFALAYGGDYAGGPLAFEPPDPSLCATTGVKTAGIGGAIGHGNYA